MSFMVILGLAQDNPGDVFQYTRYDQEKVVAENKNNAPFRLNNGGGKTINIYDYSYYHPLNK